MINIIEIVEVSQVTPAEETPKNTIWLSNLDLVAPQSHIPLVFFYRHDGGDGGGDAKTDDNFFSLDVLKASLAKTLVLFYPLAGRVVEGELGEGAGGRRLQIQCTGEGVRFTVARSDSHLSELEDFRPSPEMTKVLTPTEEKKVNQRSTIGMMVQVTYFKCGGVCLSAAIHRIIADGLAISNILRTWSAIARGLEGDVIRPTINRTAFKARAETSITFDHREYILKSPTTAAPAAVSSEGAVLGLSKSQVHFLKSRCRTKTGQPASSYAAIAIHTWRCACKARDLQLDQETRLFIPVNARSRMRSPVPPEYLGNAVVLTSVVAKVWEVLEKPAAFLMGKYREAINRVDDEYVRSIVDHLETEVEDKAAVAIGAWQLERTDLWVVSWLDMKGLYEMDLGWGGPVLVSRAQMLGSGFVYVMKQKEKDGGVAISLSLEKESLSLFKNEFNEVFNQKTNGHQTLPKNYSI